MSSILDTFYILFKTNADEGIKGNKAFEKSAKDTERALKSENDATKEVGDNFVKMAESLASVAGAFAGFTVVKSGVIAAKDYNQELGITGKLLGQNVQTLDTFSRAAEAAGGTASGALGDMKSVLQNAASSGFKSFDIGSYLRKVRENANQYDDPLQKQRVFGLAGINDRGLQTILSKGSDKDLNAFLAKYKSTLKPGDIDAVLNIQQTESSIAKSITKYWTTFTTAIQKGVGILGDAAARHISAVANSPSATVVTAGIGLGASSVVAWKGVGSILRGVKTFFTGASAAAPEAAAEVAGGSSVFGGPLAWIAAVGALGWEPYMTGLKKEKEYFDKKRTSSNQKSVSTALPAESDLVKYTDSSLPPSPVNFTGEGNFETVHGSKTVLSVLNAKAALKTAAQASPASGSSVNVNVDKIIVNTQATDSKGIAESIVDEVREEFKSGLHFLAGIFDDARAR